MELIKPEGGLNFTVTVEIQNTGSNDINNATLYFVFIKDNDIVDTEIQLLNLENKLEGRYSANFIDIPFESNSIYKAMASVYLGNELLDIKTITKQF